MLVGRAMSGRAKSRSASKYGKWAVIGITNGNRRDKIPELRSVGVKYEEFTRKQESKEVMGGPGGAYGNRRAKIAELRSVGVKMRGFYTETKA